MAPSKTQNFETKETTDSQSPHDRCPSASHQREPQAEQLADDEPDHEKKLPVTPVPSPRPQTAKSSEKRSQSLPAVLETSFHAESVPLSVRFSSNAQPPPPSTSIIDPEIPSQQATQQHFQLHRAMQTVTVRGISALLSFSRNNNPSSTANPTDPTTTADQDHQSDLSPSLPKALNNFFPAIRQRNRSTGSSQSLSRSSSRRTSSRPSEASSSGSLQQYVTEVEESIDSPPLADPSDDYFVIGGLQIASTSIVVQAVQRHDGKVCAIKVIPKTERLQTNRNQTRLRVELDIMNSISTKSPFLHSSLRSFENSWAIFVVSEYMGGGDLFAHLTARGPLSNRETTLILCDILMGLKHLHGEGYVHRDMKLENIAIGCDGRVRLIDFGLATFIGHTVNELVIKSKYSAGSVLYMPPEYLQPLKVISREMDLWATGIIAYELLTSSTPWLHTQSSRHMLIDEIREITLDQIQARFDPTFSPEMWQFISVLLRPQRNQRLPITDLMQLPLFSTVDWSAIETMASTPAVRQLPIAPFARKECTQALDSYLTLIKTSRRRRSFSSVRESASAPPDFGLLHTDSWPDVEQRRGSLCASW